MDQGPGAASGGSFISLSENEQRCYSGLHALCQCDSSGKLSASKVGELFRSSQLPAETLHQVTEVCGAKRLGYFGTGQFYIALKLLAAAQSGLPVRLESIKGDLPLPVFVGMKSELEFLHSTQCQSSDIQGHALSSVPVSAPRVTLRLPDNTMDKQEPRSPPRSPSSSPPHSPTAYRSYPYGIQRNGTEMFFTYENKHQSCPTVPQENSSPSHYGHKPPADQPPTGRMNRAPSVEKLVDRGSADYSDDPWRITAEQREYYTNQFRSLQPDLGGLILGTVAKNFFTKSKLPIPELSHIWELSDIDRDGALTFPEFCTAFHLIVARKNGYPLPETLPPTLRTSLLTQGDITATTAESVQPLIVFRDTIPRSNQQETGGVDMHISSRSGLTASKQDLREEGCKADFSPKKVTAPQDEPTQHTGRLVLRPDPPQELDLQRSKTRPRSYSSTSIDDAMKKAEEPPTPPPRPQRTHSRASSLDLNKLFQQSSQGVRSGSLPHPPALPPRPPATQLHHFLLPSEKSSQKTVQQPDFADFSRFREEVSRAERSSPTTEDLGQPKTDPVVIPQSHAPQKPVRRKLRPESQNLDVTPPLTTPFTSTSSVTKPTQRLPPRQKREIQTAIRKNKETNAVLTRLNSELQQQLKEVHKERMTLESQLEMLRPMTST
ncbi:ralBP1-associated Eps domain-containing protein 2 [Chanos chanos]|uniref:RalBP1-associated Eps domain-containing protein 2 n=1 Tax=Chanos chanos TaxID=29144 RepID=A0A6J2WEJ8_CHACN|nr:ralBP1-associated Eps domain-containing protein 2 [Chanos chanos]